MKWTSAIVAFFLVWIVVSVGFEVKADVGHGVISIAFDDGSQSLYNYAWPLMQSRGIVGTFYVVTDWISDFSGDNSFMSIAELQNLQTNGNEIGSHSKSHPSFYDLTDQQIRDECSISKQVLQSNGLTVNNFAYPYGGHNDHIDSIVLQYYRSARSAYAGPYQMSIPPSQSILTGFAGETGDSTALAQLEYMVDQAYSTNSWTIIFFHNVVPGVYNDVDTISSQDFTSFLDYIQSKGVTTLTVNQTLDIAGSALSASISPASVNMMLGGSQTFTSTVSGGVSPYTFQWYLNGSQVTGATSSTWTFTPASIGTYKIYSQVTDSYADNVQSNTATAKVVPSLVVTISPTQVRIDLGQSQTFSSSVSGGTPPYTYQWYLNGTAQSGATNPTWTFTPTQTGHYNVYLNVTDSLNNKAQSNLVSDILIYTQLLVSISPVHVKLYYGQSQTFTASVTGGTIPYTYQWYLNGTAVPGATNPTWTLTPKTNGNYNIYLNVTDSLNNKAQSNTASDVNVYSVNLLLTTEPNQTTYTKHQPVTFTVNVLNQLNPALQSTLTLTITGPNGYHYYDFQPVSVASGAVSEYGFDWVIPSVTGTYVVETSLAPTLLTAYDTVWLRVV